MRINKIRMIIFLVFFYARRLLCQTTVIILITRFIFKPNRPPIEKIDLKKKSLHRFNNTCVLRRDIARIVVKPLIISNSLTYV